MANISDFVRYLETQERPEFLPRQLDVMGLIRRLAITNPMTAARELPGKLAESRQMLENYEPGQQVSPELMNQFMNLVGGFAPMGMISPKIAAKALPETKVVDTAGNPKLMYHGTPKSIDTQLEAQKRGFVSLTPDSEFASEYAGRKFAIDQPGVPLGTATEGNPNIWPVYADVKKPFDYENPDHVKMVINKIDFASQANKENVTDNIARGNWNFIEDKQVQKIIKELGFDGFYMKEMGVKNLGVFNPEQIKSAISDPAFAGLLD